VLRLQTIVSREVAPTDAVVLTVGSLQAGTKENVIPDEAIIKLNVRTFDDDVRSRVLSAMLPSRMIRRQPGVSRMHFATISRPSACWKRNPPPRARTSAPLGRAGTYPPCFGLSAATILTNIRKPR